VSRNESRKTYTILESDIKDLEALYQLELECFGRQAYDKSLIRFLLVDPDSIALKVVDRSGRIIGSAMGRVEKVGKEVVGRIYTIEVKPGYRGRGIGRALLTKLEEEFRRRGCNKAILEVSVDNEQAIKLYRSLGYIFTKRLKNYYGRGRDAYRGEKVLMEDNPYLEPSTID